MKGFIFTLLGFGGLAGIAFFASQWFGGGVKIKEMLHGLFQKKGQQNIDEIEKKQESTMKKIMESEKVAEQTKEKIRDIKKEANKEIVKTLQKEKVEDILVGDDELWNW